MDPLRRIRYLSVASFGALLLACQPGDPVVKIEPKIVGTWNDPACDAHCDPPGANCVFPTYACGTQRCERATNQLIAQACNGKGSCSQYAPYDCPDHLTCADDAGCRFSCAQSDDCVTGFACQNGACIPSN